MILKDVQIQFYYSICYQENLIDNVLIRYTHLSIIRQSNKIGQLIKLELIFLNVYDNKDRFRLRFDIHCQC